MQAQKHEDGRVTLEFSVDEARKLADELVEEAEDLPNIARELYSLLRQAQYERRNQFRQPKGVWDGGIIYPKV